MFQKDTANLGSWNPTCQRLLFATSCLAMTLRRNVQQPSGFQLTFSGAPASQPIESNSGRLASMSCPEPRSHELWARAYALPLVLPLCWLWVSYNAYSLLSDLMVLLSNLKLKGAFQQKKIIPWPLPMVLFVFTFACCCCDKIPQQKQVREEGLIWLTILCCSSLLGGSEYSSYILRLHNPQRGTETEWIHAC